MTKNTLRKWARKLTKGNLRIDRHCAKWLLTLHYKPARSTKREPGQPAPQPVVQAKGRTLDSAGRQLFAQLEL